MIRGRNLKKAIVLLALTAAVLCFIIYALPAISKTMTKTVIAEYGSMESSRAVKCYVIRKETVYTAGNTGEIKYLAQEGEKVRKNTRVMKIKSSEPEGEMDEKFAPYLHKIGKKAKMTETYITGTNGIISYYIDGYEAVMRPSCIEKITYEDVSSISDSTISIKRKKAYRGEPVYKLYKNEEWYMLVWISEDEAPYKEGQNVSVRLPEGDIEALVESITKEDDYWKTVLSCNRYYSGLATVRTADADIVENTVSGIVLPSSCITEEDGTTGIYVKKTAGEYVFKPVRVLIENEKEAVLYENIFYDDKGKAVDTVKLYDEVLRRP